MHFNPKGVFFWLSLFGVATCFALGTMNGVYAFGVLTILVVLLA